MSPIHVITMNGLVFQNCRVSVVQGRNLLKAAFLLGSANSRARLADSIRHLQIKDGVVDNTLERCGGNALKAAIVLQEHRDDVNTYCIGPHSLQPDPGEFECSLCMVEYDAATMLCMPCGLLCCRECAREHIKDAFQNDRDPQCPNSHSPPLLLSPSIVTTIIDGRCNECFEKSQEKMKTPCNSDHTFCIICLTNHIFRCIQARVK